MKIRVILITLLAIIGVATGVILIVNWNRGEDNLQSELDVNDDEITIGVSNTQQLRFEKEDGNWMFLGVYTYDDGDYHHIGGATDGKLFRFNSIQYNLENPETILDGTIESIEVLTDQDDVKSIVVDSVNVSMTFTVEDGSNYIKREAVLVSDVDNELAEGQLGFSLRTDELLFNYENGFIATRSSKENQTALPYAFPALYGEVDGDNLSFKYSIVVDTTTTSEVFNMARRRMIQDQYEIGVISSNADIDADTEYRYTDWILFSSKEEQSINNLIELSYNKFTSVIDDQIVNLTNSGNRPADDYGVVVNNLYDDIMDDRSGIDEYLGGMSPYGYNEIGGWGEAFAAMDALKGMMRYAIWLDDEEVLNDTKELVRNFVITHDDNRRWIVPYDGENAQEDEYFFNNSYVNGSFGKNDAGEETGNIDGISTWKYYDRVINFGELALLTEDEDVINEYMKLMPFVRTLVGDDYFQPVAYFYENREPATGTENGGSAGGAAMWGYTQLLAYELSNDDDPLKETYLEDAKGSLSRAHELGIYQMYGMRDDLKPTSIGWAVRGNVRLYELTENEMYLDQANEIAQAIFHFYYASSNPQTYFPSYGFGYADNRERWEAYLEMSTSLWLMSNLMQYSDDANLLNLYYSAYQTHLWAFPINGVPYGNPSRNYDTIDGYYIPFEFSTGVQGDNPNHDGGSQSNLRQIKQIYGSGEAFLQHQMFEAWGRALHDSILMINTSQPHGRMDPTNHQFTVFNADTSDITTTLFFDQLPTGNYEMIVNDEVIDVYSETQLKNGIEFAIDAKTSTDVVIQMSDEENNSEEQTTQTEFTHETSVRSTTFSMDTDANHYKIELSTTSDFTPLHTRVLFSETDMYTVHHDQGIKYYARVTAVDAFGNSFVVSDVQAIEVPKMNIGVNEDFSIDTTDLWTVEQLTMDTDGHMAIFQMLGARDTVSSASRTFENVDVDEYSKLEVLFVTKNALHTLNISVTIDGVTTVLQEDISQIDGTFIFDLKEEITGLSGVKDVTITITADGQNRSFALNRIRFFNEETVDNYIDVFEQTMSSEYADHRLEDEILILSNDDEVSDEVVPTIDVNFDPEKYQNLAIYFEGVRAGDQFSIQIENSSGTVVFDETEYLPTEYKTPLVFNLYQAGVTLEDSYTITYSFSAMSNALIESMSLQGSEAESFDVTTAAGWTDGLNAYLDDSDVLRLKPSSAYSYGEIKKTMTINLDIAPIVTIDINELYNGAQWALKVQPQGVAADLYVINDNGNTGEVSVDLRKIITGSGELEVTFKIFIISYESSDGGVQINSLEFSDSINLISAPSDEVVSETTINYGNVDFHNTPYVVVDIEDITNDSQWRIYVKDNETNRTYELKTGVEVTYPDKYNRAKVGSYIYNLSDIMDNTVGADISFIIRLYGDSAEVEISDIYFTSDNMIPVYPIQ